MLRRRSTIGEAPTREQKGAETRSDATVDVPGADLYPFYNLCVRIYPQLVAGFDQAVGGLIIWIPPAMMSVVAMLLVLNNMRKAEEQTGDRGADDDKNADWVVDSSQWKSR